MSKSLSILYDEDDRSIRIKLTDCLTVWWLIEMALARMFCSAIKTDPQIAYHIWDSVISFEAKLNCLSSVIDVSQDNLKKLIWAKVGKKVGSASKKRNKLSHGAFVKKSIKGKRTSCYSPYLSTAKLAYPKKETKTEAFTIVDLENIESEFTEIKFALDWLASQIESQNQKQPEECLEQAPDLIKRIQNSIGQSPE